MVFFLGLLLLVVVMSPDVVVMSPDFLPIRAAPDVVVMSPDFLPIRAVPSDGVKVGQHLLQDGVLGEEAPVLVLSHGVGDGQEVLEMLLHLLLGLLDLAARGHAHARDLLPSHLGGKGAEPGHQG